jgi:uncharacterized membrane-anchored protein
LTSPIQRAASTTGPARTGRIKDLSVRARPGDILVIDDADLRVADADSLIALRPSAVVNAKRTATGRQPAEGARALVDAGILVVDGAGAAVLAVRDGTELTLQGGTVMRGTTRIANGTLLTDDAVVSADTAAPDHLKVQVAVFGSHALERLERDGAVFFEGRGLPSLGAEARDKVVLVVAGGDSVAADLRGLKRFIKERKPVIIAQGSAVQACLDARLKPAVIVGEIDEAPDGALLTARIIVTDPTVGTRARLETLGLPYEDTTVRLTGADLAALAAHHADAEVIVIAGRRVGAVDVLSTDPDTGIGAFLVALVTARSSVDAAVVARTYRHRYSAWFVWAVFGLAVGLLAFAVWASADARDLAEQAWTSITQVWES